MFKSVSWLKTGLDNHHKVLLALLLAGFFLRIFFILQDIEILLNKFLADDAFYYYSLARNIIQGHGVTFNYGIPTNGFHPLYLLILLPVFWFFYPLGINIPVYFSLIILAIFGIFTGLFLYLIVSKIWDRHAGLLAAFMWLFNPWVFFVSLSGMEAPIQVFFVSCLTYFILSRGWEKFSLRDSLIIGFFIGLIFLSRMDGVFIGVGILLALFFHRTYKQQWWHRLLTLFKQRDFFVITTVAFLTVLPWLIWELIAVGTIFPISGQALRLLRLKGNLYADLVVSSILRIFWFVGAFFLYPTVNAIRGGLTIFIFMVMPCLILLKQKQHRVIFNLARSIDFLLIASFFYYIFYCFYELGLREWYSLWTDFLVTILFSVLVVAAIENIKRNVLRKLASILLVTSLMSLFFYSGTIKYLEGNYPQEKLKFEVARYLDENIPANINIGSFNAGIFQYYSQRHDIVNLDGVVNPEAYYALRENKIENYILEKKITYIVDSPMYVKNLRSSIIKIKPIKNFEISFYFNETGWGQKRILLYKVTPT